MSPETEVSPAIKVGRDVLFDPIKKALAVLLNGAALLLMTPLSLSLTGVSCALVVASIVAATGIPRVALRPFAVRWSGSSPATAIALACLTLVWAVFGVFIVFPAPLYVSSVSRLGIAEAAPLSNGDLPGTVLLLRDPVRIAVFRAASRYGWLDGAELLMRRDSDAQAHLQFPVDGALVFDAPGVIDSYKQRLLVIPVSGVGINVVLTVKPRGPDQDASTADDPPRLLNVGISLRSQELVRLEYLATPGADEWADIALPADPRIEDVRYAALVGIGVSRIALSDLENGYGVLVEAARHAPTTIERARVSVLLANAANVLANGNVGTVQSLALYDHVYLELMPELLDRAGKEANRPYSRRPLVEQWLYTALMDRYDTAEFGEAYASRADQLRQLVEHRKEQVRAATPAEILQSFGIAPDDPAVAEKVRERIFAELNEPSSPLDREEQRIAGMTPQVYQDAVSKFSSWNVETKLFVLASLGSCPVVTVRDARELAQTSRDCMQKMRTLGTLLRRFPVDPERTRLAGFAEMQEKFGAFFSLGDGAESLSLEQLKSAAAKATDEVYTSSAGAPYVCTRDLLRARFAEADLPACTTSPHAWWTAAFLDRFAATVLKTAATLGKFPEGSITTVARVKELMGTSFQTIDSDGTLRFLPATAFVLRAVPDDDSAEARAMGADLAMQIGMADIKTVLESVQK